MAQNIEATDKIIPQSEISPVKQEQVIEPQEVKPEEAEKKAYVTPQSEITPNKPDSGKISVIRQNSPHLMEKME